MKNELMDFIKKETGYNPVGVEKAIKKYFKGKEVEWEEKSKIMYIHETQTLSCSNGELYIEGEFGEIVWNCETLFTDLPHITRMVLKAREETTKRIIEDLEELTRLVTQ
jgi:hypothetical protein